jgi:hypothetical protein
MSDSAAEHAADLDVHEVEDGLVIYDLGTDRVHYLNETASLVFALCTGEHSDRRIAELIGQAWQLPHAPEDEVRACLAQLRGEGLIR